MYDYVKGKLTEVTPTYAVVEAAGVGYYIVISLNTYAQIEKADEVKVYVHYTVREDAQIFYGFADRQEREVFRLLIGVSGVGGNTARTILSTYSPPELANIISSDNAPLLKNVRGLGIKTAQKIIVDLRDKITVVLAGAEQLPGMDVPEPGSYEEAVAALNMLGFPKAASEKAVRAAMKDNPAAPVEEVIRISLKQL